MLTLHVKVRCDACKGQGLIRRGRWIEDKYTFQQQHITEEYDCEQCGGAGSYPQTITLEETAIRQLANAIAAALPAPVRVTTTTAKSGRAY